MSRKIELAALLTCFFLSGLAALIYQTAWLRQFSIVFGTSELAVAIVLAAYMGGLALGAGLAAGLVSRVSRPVTLYGWLEAGIALSALAVPALLLLADRMYAGLLGGRADLPSAWTLGQPLFYVATAFLVLAIPTALMGATLPLLTRHIVRRDTDVGPRVAILYALNTAGAVGGTLLAAFVLLPRMGLNATVWTGATINALVFAVALLLARTAANAVKEPEAGIIEKSQVSARSGHSIVLPLMLCSGAATFLYEVLWTRMLTHVLGGSVYAFATMLAAFLTGIAAGGALGGVLARDRNQAATAFVFLQVGIAVLAALVYTGMQGLLPESRDTAGLVLYAFGVMLPATFCIGCTYPVAVRVLCADESTAASASARVYGWNTVGAIFGAMLAGFWLIPSAGFSGAIRVGVLVNLLLAVGAAVAFMPARRRTLTAATTATFLIALLAWFPARPVSVVARTAFETQLSMQSREVFFAVGRSATVRLTEGSGYFDLHTNGLPEASILPRGAAPVGQTQQWLTALPLIARPAAESMLLVGLGGGVALENVPTSIAAIDVVELEPEVVAANRMIGERRLADPLEDPRVTIVLNDARNALRLSEKRYDIIVSQPSHPWTAGASHLFTREFFSLARSHLQRDGIFLQWMSAGFIDEALFRSLAATLSHVFAHVRVYQPAPTVLLFIASDGELGLEANLARTGLPLRDDPLYFSYLRINGIEDLLAALILDESGIRAIGDNAPHITDNRNSMATASRTLADGLSAAELDRMLTPYDPLSDPEGWVHADHGASDLTYVATRLIADGQPTRTQRFAEAIQDASTRAMIEGLLAGSAGDLREARNAFLAALQIDASNEFARFALLEPELPGFVRGTVGSETRQLAAGLRGTATAVLRGWRLAGESDWPALAALDEMLAQVRPTDLWYPQAIQLRADWRTKVVGDTRPARDAIRLIDRAVAIRPDLDLFVLRAAAAEILGDIAAFRESSRYATRQAAEQLTNIEAGRRPASAAELDSMFRRIYALRGLLVQLTADGDPAALSADSAALSDQMGEQLRRIQVLQR